MNYAIIAAGEGSRLASEGITAPKPLVEINGECLIDRLVRIFSDNDAERIVVICNEQMTAVQEHIRSLQHDCSLQQRPAIELVVKSTPSSMHSFHELSKLLRTDTKKFILTTVDTIFNEKEFADYVSRFATEDCDALMGLTNYIDDEKPLYVAVQDDRITGYYDEPNGCTHISAGIYGLTPTCFPILDHCIATGQSRMRNFQRALVASGLTIRPHLFSQVLDIDHKSDILKCRTL